MAEQLATTDLAEAHANNRDLTLAAKAIFGDNSNTFPLTSGKQCVVSPCTMENFPDVIDYFEIVLSSLDKNQVAGLVDMIVDTQVEAIKRGASPDDISVKDLTTADLVEKAFGQVSIFTTIFSTTFRALPNLVAKFTNLTADEFKKMHPDEGMLVTAAIFVVNYSFFSRSLPPLLTVFARQWVGKHMSDEAVAKVRRATNLVKRRSK